MSAVASAPGKAILLGEHAVIYGQPAIAVPIRSVAARATVEAIEDDRLRIEAPDIDFSAWHDEISEDHPLWATILAAETYLIGGPLRGARLSVRSDIPVASGMGSSAAVSLAIFRAIAEYIDQPRGSPEHLARTVEEVHHGMSSGIDPTVIGLDRPIYFERESDPVPLQLAAPLHLVVAGSGRSTPTHEMVEYVRQRRSSAVIQSFERIGELVKMARTALETGQMADLGSYMDSNHEELQMVGVSTPELDRLVSAARSAGAHGAKLSGGGGGGIIASVAAAERMDAVAEAVASAGGHPVIRSEIET